MDKVPPNASTTQAYVNDNQPSEGDESALSASAAAVVPSTAPRVKKSQAALAASATSSVDAVGAVSSAGHSAPAAGGVTQGGPNLPDVEGDKASLAAVQMAIGSYVAPPRSDSDSDSDSASILSTSDSDTSSQSDTSHVFATAPSQPVIAATSGDSSTSSGENRSAGGVIHSAALSVNGNADISMAAMYTILQTVIATAQKLSGNIKRGAQQGAVNAKEEGVQDTLAKLDADKKDAGAQLGASIAGGALSLFSAFKGSSLQNNGQESAGAMLSALSRPISDLTTQIYNTISINSGFQLDSRLAEARVKTDDVDAQVAQNNVESTKGGWDATTEFLRNLNQFFLTLVQNKKSAIDQTAQR